MSRNYSSTAVDTTLTGGISAAATTISVGSTTGFPAAPFILALGAGSVTQELVLVTAVSGLSLTVTRGYDSTVANTHDTGAVVSHSHAAIDFREAGTHIDATAAHGATGAVVGTTNNQTLTNKTVALGSNTVSGTKAQFNAALTDADIATLDGAETLTNKTIDLPTTTLTPIPFTAVTAFSNGWVNYGTGYQPAQYRKVGDMVEVRGLIKLGTVGAVAFTLPAGLRPAARFVVVQMDGNNAAAALHIDVDGNVIPSSGVNSFHTLDCTFSVLA